MSTCVSCNQPLVLELEEEEDDYSMEASSSGKAPAAAPETVPDDLHLNCGCHFHWDCLLQAYQITQCPNCNKDITSTSSTGQQQVLCNLHNEGGLQENLDILPLLTEESYLRAYPEDRKCRAFLEFCREGDFKAVIEMLRDDDDEDEDEEMDTGEEGAAPQRKIGADELLRYQDPIGDMQSGLHAAVQAGSREVAWLLLLLASKLDLLEFPPEVFQEAEALGVMRDESEGKTDIRSLKDSNGKSAEDLAREVGGVWSDWIGKNRLTM
ncbi:hypothetical protein BU24DRAFT_266827 [Aaosphaeria arxii CBS 175.79]|uniref:Uncharacterized protein n=1 Tax=Aaosphaeria arxii CBS 175.79 TaxID=1450172 RepID=A0A6A5XGJ1_9PLEO|nr:uncharacterized protein BU24DRAFT_266827 [Aaosphaeria arxii CBS 175.79]KAF2011941.1 hypothetical protein BU24DRAFT_266827 [Aaosphaeria arxii CBS 175.79]